MSIRERKACHPGEILFEEFITAFDLSIPQLAVLTGLTEDYIIDLIEEEERITPTSAEKLGRALGTSPQFWEKLQYNYDNSPSTAFDIYTDN